MKIRPLVLTTFAIVGFGFVLWMTTLSQGSTTSNFSPTIGISRPLATPAKPFQIELPRYLSRSPTQVQAVSADPSLAQTLEEEDLEETDQVEEEQAAGLGLEQLRHNLHALDSPLKPRIVPLRTEEQSSVDDEILDPNRRPEMLKSIDFASRNIYNKVSLFLVEKGFDDGRSHSNVIVKTSATLFSPSTGDVEATPSPVELNTTVSDRPVSPNASSAAPVSQVKPTPTVSLMISSDDVATTKINPRLSAVQQPVKVKTVQARPDVLASHKSSPVMATKAVRAMELKPVGQINAPAGHKTPVTNRGALASPQPVIQEVAILIADAKQLGHQKLARVQDAVANINQATQKAGLNLKLTAITQPTAPAAITLREAGTQELASNHLGYAKANANARFGGVASINKNFDWYTGSETDQIASTQFDYQTVVTHELLHLLGLEDRFASASDSDVMADTLSQGVVSRTLGAANSTRIKQAFGRGVSVSRSGALTAVPEPATLSLLGLCSLTLLRRQRN